MHRFTRQSRLLQAAEFRAVFNGNPCTVGDQHFRLLAIPSPPTATTLCQAQQHASSSRLGLAIAKKSVRKASQRNRIKRQARDVFRNFMPLQQATLCSVEGSVGAGRDATPIACALDIVVLARPAAASADKAELRRSLQRLLQQLIEKQNTLSQSAAFE